MKPDFKMFYDTEADVLYVTKGHPPFTDYFEYGVIILFCDFTLIQKNSLDLQ